MPSWADLMALMRLTLGDPRRGAAEVLDRAPGAEAVWLMFALVLTLTLMAGEVATMLFAERTMSLGVIAGLQAATFLLLAVGVARIGRAFGGEGDFHGALVLVTWLQFIFLFVQIAQVVVLVILPPVATLVVLLSVGLFLWLLANFIAELHGFASLARVFMGIVATLLALWVVLSLIAGAFGIEVAAWG